MSGNTISIVDLANQHGKRRQAIHKIVKRLRITPRLIRCSENGGQKISYITNEEALRVSEYISTAGTQGAKAERFRSNSGAPLSDSEQGFFYLLRCEPQHDPGRFKVGFGNVEERMRKFKTAAPFYTFERSWPCKLLWEKTAIECVTQGCEKLGEEVFRTNSIESVIAKCEAFFSLMPKPAFSGQPSAEAIEP